MPGQVLLMAALHDHDLGAGFGIVHTGGHDHVEPVDRSFPDRIRFCLLDIMRIVANYSIATLARGCSAHRRGEPVAGTVVVEAPFGVLVAGESKAIRPALPVPGRFNEASAFD